MYKVPFAQSSCDNPSNAGSRMMDTFFSSWNILAGIWENEAGVCDVTSSCSSLDTKGGREVTMLRPGIVWGWQNSARTTLLVVNTIMNSSTGPHEMRITDHGKIKGFVAFALKFLSVRPNFLGRLNDTDCCALGKPRETSCIAYVTP